jgi:hypothetical protein
MFAEFVQFAAVSTHSHLYDHLTILSVTFHSVLFTSLTTLSLTFHPQVQIPFQMFTFA